MESLAYLYLAQDYELPEDQSIASLKHSASTTLGMARQPNVAVLGMASLFCLPGVVGLAQGVQAQTYSSEGLYPSSIYAFEENSAPYTSGATYLTPENSIYGSSNSYTNYRYLQPDGEGYTSAIYPCGYYPGGYPSGYVPIRPAPQQPGNSGSLRLGDSGDDVRQLQDLLRNAGYFNSPSTGYFGTTTESAVTAFQQDYGLVADGVAGSQTLAALQGNSYRPVRPGSSVGQAGLLQYGDRGTSVSQIQSALKSLGYYGGTIDGVFGASTEAAVQTFQVDYGLSGDGVVGAATLRALQSVYPGLA